jgi:hypothetical protein
MDYQELPEAGHGYIVKRSNARKGKTHVVIGPDGTKKYFGDSHLGQHPKDPKRKKAFYARHAKNLKNNAYFRAFARKTWEDGGLIPDIEELRIYANGGQYVTAGNEYHKVYKSADGDIMVNHPKEDKGKWDTINLTDKSDAHTIAQGVQAVKDWHKEHPSYAKGGMIKRADGHYSQHGLWDSIRENKGSGKKPTKAMLAQEKKIKANKKKDGGKISNWEIIEEFRSGGKVSNWQVVEDMPMAQTGTKFNPLAPIQMPNTNNYAQVDNTRNNLQQAKDISDLNERKREQYINENVPLKDADKARKSADPTAYGFKKPDLAQIKNVQSSTKIAPKSNQDTPSEARTDLRYSIYNPALNPYFSPSWGATGSYEDMMASKELTQDNAMNYVGEAFGIVPVTKFAVGLKNTIPTFGKNIEDLKYAQQFANKYGYEKPSVLNNFLTNSKTNEVIQNLAKEHNTFVRGVSTNFEKYASDHPEIINHLEEQGIDWKNNPKAAAEYMASHIPPETGYGRAGMNSDMFKDDLQGLYTSNSLPTAEGYTYGKGYKVKVRKPTDFSSLNRKDWLDKNDFNIITGRQQLTDSETDKYLDKYYDIVDSEDYKNKANDLYTNKYEALEKKAEENKDWVARNMHQMLRDQELKNWAEERAAYEAGVAEKLGYGIKYKNRDVILAAKKQKSPYAHYIHLGKPGEKVLEPIESIEVTPENYFNSSRAHKGKFSEGFTRKKQMGGKIKSNWQIIE